MNSSRNAYCLQLFKELNILPIQPQQKFSIILIVIKNKDQFLFYSQLPYIKSTQGNLPIIPTFSKLDNTPEWCLLLRN
jgi:hypothetical protein